MVLELFEKLTKIPRCSLDHEPFVQFLSEFAKHYGYQVFTDKVSNILCRLPQKTQNLALQAHYDIVCLKENIVPKIIDDGKFLSAEDSTLGADNGIACAYMLALMMEQKNLEFLFTSDEEIGLIGANNLEFDISSKYMLNLDSENDEEICIGCAGGIDIIGSFDKKHEIDLDDFEIYELLVEGLPGGHSGVDIDKNIENALCVLTNQIINLDAKIISINGGERINSIPKRANAIIATNKIPTDCDFLKRYKLKNNKNAKIIDPEFLNFFVNYKNGVLEFNDDLGVVETSINLAKIYELGNEIIVEFSARSMDNNKLEYIKINTVKCLKDFGFGVKTNGKYFAWKPNVNEFSKSIKLIFEENGYQVEFKAIHAGLECAVINAKYLNISIASIGPNIYYPHSNREKVEIKSINKIFDIVKKIVEKYE